MKKDFKVIYLDSIKGVVVDETVVPKIGDMVYNKKTNSIDRVVSTSEVLQYPPKEDNICGIDAAVDYKHPVVIATIGHQLKGLPMIRIREGDSLHLADEAMSCLPLHLKDKATESLIHVGGFIKGYKSAQEKYRYTEAQMLGFAEYLILLTYKYGKWHGNRNEEYTTQELFEKYLQSLNLPEQISQVTLEMEDYSASTFFTRRNLKLKIHEQTPEGGIIIPLSVTYK